MTNKNSHIIQRQSIEIEFEDLGHAIGVQNQIAEIFYERLQPQMQVLLDELFGNNYYASIDKLEVDCGLLNKKNWEQEFTEKALRKLKEALEQVNKKEIDSEKIEQVNAEETFLYFLENGCLPWNKRINTIAELEQLLDVNENLVLQLKNLIAQQPAVAERLVYQFSENFTSIIIEAITQHRKIELDEIYLLIKKLNLSSTHKLIVEASILKAFVPDENKNSKQEFVTHLLSHFHKNAGLKSEIKEILAKERGYESNNLAEEKKEKKTGKKDRGKNEQLHEAIYINNAGLVLLHPFLPTLFNHLQLTEENKWIDPLAQITASLVSEFLVTGNDEVEEFNLVLNKILCGINFDEVIITSRQLVQCSYDHRIENECEELLTGVIKHWSVLKNTTPAGLREAFLQRNGKLSRIDNGWLLQVEQKAIDVLLAHLPWGTGLIKLPWMEDMVFVEWT